MKPQLILLILFLASGGFLILLSIPLILRKVPPNPWYGFRVRRTLDDPDIWYPANEYSAWYIVGLGAAIMLTGTVAYFIAADIATYASAVGIVATIGVITMLVQSFRYVRSFPNEK